MLSHLAQIPLVKLQHEDHALSFAIKDMAEINDAHHGMIEPPHRHNFYTLIWHKSGAGVHVVDFVQYDLAPNQIYFLAPGQVHQIIGRGRPEGWVLLFTRDFIEEAGWAWQQFVQLGLYDACQQLPPIQVLPPEVDLLEGLMQSIKQEFLAEGIETNAMIASLLRMVLITCYRHKQQQLQAPGALLSESNNITEGPSSRQQQTVQQFMTLVEAQHQKLHQVGQYAELLSVSAGYLNELIKSHTGRTAKDVIMDRLVLTAKREALFTDRSSKEVAFALGFEDPAHFSKFFKTATDTTFMAYRQQVRTGTAAATA